MTHTQNFSTEDKYNMFRNAGWDVFSEDKGETFYVYEPYYPRRGPFSSLEAGVEECWDSFLVVNAVYEHKKGGVYKYMMDGRDHNGDRVAIYKHLWPHDAEVRTRPHSEFFETDRFWRVVPS